MPPSKRRRISEELEMGRRGLKFVRKLKRPREKEREKYTFRKCQTIIYTGSTRRIKSYKGFNLSDEKYEMVAEKRIIFFPPSSPSWLTILNQERERKRERETGPD